MKNFDYKMLDETLHSRIRLAIMATLVTVESADFTFLREKVKATDGNLSVHLRKLEEAGYITVTKAFAGRKPKTSFSVTEVGRSRLEQYFDHLRRLLDD